MVTESVPLRQRALDIKEILMDQAGPTKRPWQIKQWPSFDPTQVKRGTSQNQDKRIFVKESKQQPVVPQHDLIKSPQQTELPQVNYQRIRQRKLLASSNHL